MKPISFKRHRFPADVIRHVVWLYFRFSLSFRDVEELMAARGVDVSYETIRCWTIKSGPLIARRLKKRRWPPTPRWRLDEMVCWIGGKRMYLWRAVDDPTTRAPAAAVQITSLSPEIPHHPSGDLQHLQHPAPFDQQTHTSPLPRRGGDRLGGSGCVNLDGQGAFQPTEVSLTAP